MSLKEIGPFVHAKGPIFKDFYGGRGSALSLRMISVIYPLFILLPYSLSVKIIYLIQV